MRFALLGITVLTFCNLQAQFRYGVEGGGIYSFNSIKTESSVYTYQDIILVSPSVGSGGLSYGSRTYLNGTLHGKYSYYAGVTFDYKLNPGLSLRSKVLLENKGWQEDFKKNGTWLPDIPPFQFNRSDSVSGKEWFKLSYITVPLNLIFYAPFKKTQLFFGAGCYFGFGVIGKYKVNISQTTFPSIRDSIGEIAFSVDTALYRSAIYHAYHFDFGLNVCAGIELRNGIFFTINYSNGIKDVIFDRYGYKDIKTGQFLVTLPNRNRAFTIGVGYFLPCSNRRMD
ncbi:MAG: hypothetical protein C5B59_16605 [Bacteroidetes bacterium]|nr:MAG: hypothetical protein C5B59_16605 [Bacteroidota bacterium]